MTTDQLIKKHNEIIKSLPLELTRMHKHVIEEDETKHMAYKLGDEGILSIWNGSYGYTVTWHDDLDGYYNDDGQTLIDRPLK